MSAGPVFAPAGRRMPPVALLLGALAAGTLAGLAPALGAGAFVGTALLLLAFASQEAGLALLILGMLLSPELSLGGGGGEGLETGREVTIRMDDLLLVALCAGWWCRVAVERATRFPIPWGVAKPMIAYAAVCAISTVMGLAAGRVGVSGVLFVAKYVEYFTVFFAAMGPLGDARRCRRFLGIFLAVAVIVCVVALLQIPQGHRISAPFEGEPEPNTLGAYLVLAGCVVTGIWLEGSRWMRWTAPALILLFGVTVLLTLSRSSWLAAAAALFSFLAMSRRRLLIGGLVAVLAVAAPIFLPSSVKDRVLRTFTEKSSQYQVDVAGVSLDASTSARIESWSRVLTAAAARPVFGHGVTGFGFVDAQYFKLLADTGIAGLAAFVWFLSALGLETVRVFRRSRLPESRGIAMGFAAGITAMAVHALGANTFILVRVMEPFCFLAAVVVAGVPALEREGETP